ncbi:hypothetical protein E2C01_059579 [Portunus trituberculatus]|uniref:Uncharacterized protein n=1 Tax=Portunus trituberculatus TaxID=210409 RepID=A0A5B7H733_PORTR|nr:hypothetical protein [Portunus trituberculatus]
MQSIIAKQFNRKHEIIRGKRRGRSKATIIQGGIISKGLREDGAIRMK